MALVAAVSSSRCNCLINRFEMKLHTHYKTVDNGLYVWVRVLTILCDVIDDKAR